MLRGDRARFQLFGDTMNLASRMESTGQPGRIQVSTETAEILKASGRERWVTPRENRVDIKGKGELQTYWLVAKGASPGSQTSSGDTSNAKFVQRTLGDDYYRLSNDQTSRIIEWNVDILTQVLKQIVARRNSRVWSGRKSSSTRSSGVVDERIIQAFEGETDPLDEVCEIIELPRFDSENYKKHAESPDSIVLPPKVVNQLREYVKCLAGLYRSNVSKNKEETKNDLTSSSTQIANS